MDWKTLPNDIINIIFAYDNTFHDYYKTPIFKYELMKNIYTNKVLQKIFSKRLKSCILEFNTNDNVEWYNEFGFSGNDHYQSYYGTTMWHFSNEWDFDIIFKYDNIGFLKFKILPCNACGKEYYFEKSEYYDGIICDYYFHNQLLHLNNDNISQLLHTHYIEQNYNNIPISNYLEPIYDLGSEQLYNPYYIWLGFS